MTNSVTKYEIATDACQQLKKVVREVPNSKWIYSRFHGTQYIFNKGEKRI